MMLALFSRNHPLKNVHRKLPGLVDAVQKLNRHRDRFGKDPRVIAQLKELELSAKGLGWAIGKELELCSEYGTTSREGTRHIQGSARYLATSLMNLDRLLELAKLSHARKLVRYLDRAALPLGKAIERLAKAVASGSVPVVTAYGSFPEGFMNVREALRTIDLVAAEKLTGPEVDSLRRWPGFNDEDPREVRRMAKLIWLGKLPDQEFRLMVQSDAPGRPLKLVKRFTAFPTEGDLKFFGHSQGPMKFYVVVTKPSWRKAWVFDPDNVEWCDCLECLRRYFWR